MTVPGSVSDRPEVFDFRRRTLGGLLAADCGVALPFAVSANAAEILLLQRFAQAAGGNFAIQWPSPGLNPGEAESESNIIQVLGSGYTAE